MRTSELRLFLAEYALATDMDGKSKAKILEFISDADRGELYEFLVEGEQQILTEDVGDVKPGGMAGTPQAASDVTYGAPYKERIHPPGGYRRLLRIAKLQAIDAYKAVKDKITHPSQVVKAVRDYAEKVHKAHPTKTGAVAALGAAGIATLAIMLSRSLYKNHLSAASRACSQFKGADKDQCMSKVRKQGISNSISALESSKSQCKGSSDPALCTKRINERIGKLKAKM